MSSVGRSGRKGRGNVHAAKERWGNPALSPIRLVGRQNNGNNIDTNRTGTRHNPHRENAQQQKIHAELKMIVLTIERVLQISIVDSCHYKTAVSSDLLIIRAA